MRIEDLQKMLDFDESGNIVVNNSKKVVIDYSDIENVPEGGEGGGGSGLTEAQVRARAFLRC